MIVYALWAVGGVAIILAGFIAVGLAVSLAQKSRKHSIPVITWSNEARMTQILTRFDAYRNEHNLKDAAIMAYDEVRSDIQRFRDVYGPSETEAEILNRLLERQAFQSVRTPLLEIYKQYELSRFGAHVPTEDAVRALEDHVRFFYSRMPPPE